MRNDLPEVKKMKKINLEKFAALAKKVKEAFKEENEYLDKKYGNNTPSRLLTNH